MKRVRVGVLALLVVAAAAGGYMMFRTSTGDNTAIGIIRGHRSWGRITRVTVDTDRDGRVDGEFFFSWSRPFAGNNGNEANSHREDRNLDGQWDTWFDYDRSILEIDTNNDGKPDMELDATDSWAAYLEAEEIRGF